MNINISVQKRHLYILSVLILAFGTIIFVQGQGVSNFGHTLDQIEDLEITGMIAMFDMDCPSGWTRFSDLDGKFPRGDTVANQGITGGSNEWRIQAYSAGTDYGSNAKMVRRVRYEWRDGPVTTVGLSSGGDAWDVGPWTVHNPSYINVVYCTKD